MKLQKGDAIGIISQSWCGPEIFAHVLDKGIENVQKMGFIIKEFPFTRKQGSPKERAEDLTQAFLDDDVKAIISSIGGDDCVLLLEHLDIDLLTKHKKPFLGYSDPTALFAYFSQHGIPCYYGPTMMAGFAQCHLYPEWFTYLEKTMLGEELPLIPFDEYNDGYDDWSDGTIGLSKKKNDGFRYLTNLEGKGKLFGGCIDVLEFIKGTKYWPNDDFWNDKVLFFETSEDKPTVTQVKYMLRNYGLLGILEKVNGILFGRAREYSDSEKKDLDEMILSVLDEFSVNIPVVTNVDFGHTDPQFILSYNKEVVIEKDRLYYS